MSLTRLACLVPLAACFAAAPASGEEIDNAKEYRACMDKAKSAPKDAFDMAVHWQGLGGGEAAKHCAAVALWRLGESAEAAKRLQELADASRQAAPLRAGMYNQAGQAWLEVGDVDRAHAAQSAAIALVPDDPNFFLDRALIGAERGDYRAALDDVEQAVKLDPYWADAWALRGAAQRFLDDLPGALASLNKAVDLAPGHAEALLERGIVHRLMGDDNAARRDWATLVRVAPDGPAAEKARANLQILELGADAKPSQ